MTYSKLVCLVRPEKANPNRTCITFGGKRIFYPGNVGTKTTSLDLFKLVLNRVLSRKDANYVTFNISNFCLQTPLDRPEYVRINLSYIYQDFIDEYDLVDFVQDGWVYFGINRGVYILPQPGILVNKLLKERLDKHGYYQCTTNPGLWRHKWIPIFFSLIADDFGVEYSCNRRSHHLRAG